MSDDKNQDRLNQNFKILMDETNELRELIEGIGENSSGGSTPLPPVITGGTTFIPSVSSDGVISWTNDGGLTNPNPVNIKGEKGEQGEQGLQGLPGTPGVQGERGSDGISATHSWNETVLTITSASGTSSADLKGDKGDTGPQGEQGPKGDKGDPALSSAFTVTLLQTSWTDKTQTVTANGVTESNNIIATPAPDTFLSYVNSGVWAAAQASNSITFKCRTQPTTNLVVNILILN